MPPPRAAVYLLGLCLCAVCPGEPDRPFLDAMLQVPIVHLSDGLHTETLTPSAEDVGLDPDVFADLRVALRLDIRDRRVLATFETSATATLECDRTLEMYPQPIEGSHAVLFVPPGSPSLEGVEDADQAVLPLATDATELDLTAPVHDTLLLAIPLRRVSPAAEALEIETQFGDAQPERDTRWDALRALGTDDDSSTD